MYPMLLVLAASPLIIFCIHIFTSRLSQNPSRQKKAISAAFLGYPVSTLLLWFAGLNQVEGSGAIAWTLIYAFIVYNGFAHFYFHLFNMSETARRIRIFCEIYDSGGNLSEDQIVSIYGATDLLSVRVARLVTLNQLELKDGVYIMKGRLLFYAASFVKMWGILLGFPPLDQIREVDQE